MLIWIKQLKKHIYSKQLSKKKKKITALLIPKDISTEEKLVEEMNVGVNFYDKASKLKNEIKLSVLGTLINP